MNRTYHHSPVFDVFEPPSPRYLNPPFPSPLSLLLTLFPSITSLTTPLFIALTLTIIHDLRALKILIYWLRYPLHDRSNNNNTPLIFPRHPRPPYDSNPSPYWRTIMFIQQEWDSLFPTFVVVFVPCWVGYPTAVGLVPGIELGMGCVMALAVGYILFIIGLFIWKSTCVWVVVNDVWRDIIRATAVLLYEQWTRVLGRIVLGRWYVVRRRTVFRMVLGGMFGWWFWEFMKEALREGVVDTAIRRVEDVVDWLLDLADESPSDLFFVSGIAALELVRKGCVYSLGSCHWVVDGRDTGA